MKNRRLSLLAIVSMLLVIIMSFTACDLGSLETDGISNEALGSGESTSPETPETSEAPSEPTEPEIPALTKPLLLPSSVPAYSSAPWVAINGNVPSFTSAQITDFAYEYYSDLDSLGRCGIAVACLGPELLPTGERGDISSVKPTGWHSTSYGSVVPGGSLYNRFHLIAWSLAGEDANVKNLITGTQYMNQLNMTEFEDMVRDYIKETGNHVMYRVTPIYDGNNLVASGVQMEAYSVEDEEEEISFNVYLYNVQPNIIIDYATGDHMVDPNYQPGQGAGGPGSAEGANYLINTSSGKVHHISCSSGQTTSEKNRYYSDAETLEEAIEEAKGKIPEQAVLGMWLLPRQALRRRTNSRSL